MSADWQKCACGREWFDACEYSMCYPCAVERRGSITCIFCDRRHSTRYNVCYRCRASSPDRDLTGRDLRLDILIRDGFTCRDCGSDVQPEVDHIMPIGADGEATPWNLQVLCRPHHLAKGGAWEHGCRWDKTRVELMHLYFTFGWPMLDDDQRQDLIADARGYSDEFTWHAHFPGPRRELPDWALAEADAFGGEGVGDYHSTA